MGCFLVRCPACSCLHSEDAVICPECGVEFFKEENQTPQHPQHYSRFAIEPLTFIMVNNIPFPEGNVIKYVCRWRHKNGIEDLKKARAYLDHLIEVEENKGDFK